MDKKQRKSTVFCRKLSKSGGAEPLSILLAQGYLSNVETKLNLEKEYRNLRKLPECQVGIGDPLSQIWLVGKETLQGPRNGRK